MTGMGLKPDPRPEPPERDARRQCVQLRVLDVLRGRCDLQVRRYGDPHCPLDLNVDQILKQHFHPISSLPTRPQTQETSAQAWSHRSLNPKLGAKPSDLRIQIGHHRTFVADDLAATAHMKRNPPVAKTAISTDCSTKSAISWRVSSIGSSAPGASPCGAKKVKSFKAFVDLACVMVWIG